MAHTLSIYDMTPGAVVADHFRVVRPHRQGGMSSAFEVVDERVDEPRELQFFPPALFEGDDQAGEFAHAWEPWTRVVSDSVLKVHELVELGPTTMILITDFPPEESLRERLRGMPRFPTQLAVEMGCQLLSGLVAVHEQGLVHGDIKPHTIHVDGKQVERAVLVDGGITPGLWSAKGLGEKTALIGTPYYSPAQQFSGDAPDVQSDIYNVATVLYEVLTGALPWSGRNILEVFQAKLERTAPAMKERAPEVSVPGDLEAAIQGGLLAERTERYPTAQEFLDRLGACAAD
jgi:serine/threonine protein kinase